MVILIFDKVDFRAKKITRDKDVIIQVSIHQKDISILNIYSQNNSLKLQEPKTDRLTRQKIGKDIGYLNNTTSQQNLINIYKTLYSKTAEHIFFSSRPYPR